MEDNFLSEQFSQTFKKLIPEDRPDSIGFFLDSQERRIASTITNGKFYYFDLSKIQSYQILGYNHPISIRSNIFALHNNLNTQLLLQYYNFSELFEGNLSCVISSLTPPRESVELCIRDIKCHLQYARKKKEIMKSPSFFIKINQYQNIILSKEILDIDQEEVFEPARYFELFLTLRMFLKSNLLDENGKVCWLNSKIKEIAQSVENIEYAGPLNLSITDIDSVQFENLKNNGVLGEYMNNKILLFFPTTVLEDELIKIQNILQKVF